MNSKELFSVWISHKYHDIDEETNELVQMLVDKARKIRITPLKKAILLKRQRVLLDRTQRKDEKRLLKEAVDKVKE